MARVISGNKTVTAAGTAVALGTQTINGPVVVKALTTNTGLVYIGNDGNNDVDSNTGMSLAAGDSAVFYFVGCLSSIYVDAAVNGEGVRWLNLTVEG